MKMTAAQFLATLSTLLATAGVAVLIFVLVSLVQEQSAGAQTIVMGDPTVTQREYGERTTHGKPVSITVPSVGVATAVQDGYYDASSGHWSLSEEAAFFATLSDEANNKEGSTFIYGHNSDKIFGKLRNINNGAEAIVRTDNGYEFIYSLTGVEHVKPTDAGKLTYDGSPRLVLQTCSGFWNETRQLSYFRLVSVKLI